MSGVPDPIGLPSRRTAILFAGGLGLGLCVLIGRLGWHQLGVDDERRAAIAERLIHHRSIDPNQWSLGERAVRGLILDRNGRELARSAFSHTLVIDPREMVKPRERDDEAKAEEADDEQRPLRRRRLASWYTIQIESALLEGGTYLEDDERHALRRRMWVAFGLAGRVKGTDRIATLAEVAPLGELKRWVRIHEGISSSARASVAAALRRRDVGAFSFEHHATRSHPQGHSVSQLLGNVGHRLPVKPAPGRKAPELSASEQAIRNAEIVGQSGIEKAWNEELTGIPGRKVRARDVRGRQYVVPGAEDLPPQHGEDIVLTVDADISRIALEACQEAMAKWPLRGVHAVVLDARRGDVLAAVSAPVMLADEIEVASDVNNLTNRALTRTFAPGSVIKPLWWASALEEGVVNSRERWACGGIGRVRFFGSRRVEDTKSLSEPVPMRDALVYSSNVASVRVVSERLGLEGVFRAVDRFGLRRAARPRFPGLARMQIFEKLARAGGEKGFRRDWGPDWGQGYNIRLSVLEMARMYLPFANGGRLVEPRLVGHLREPGGEWERTPRRVRTVLSPQNASLMLDALRGVVEEGTAKKLGQGLAWTAAAKTGSMRHEMRRDPMPWHYDLSMVAITPATAPRIVVAVTAEHYRRKSASDPYGSGTIAAPVVRSIIERTLEHLRVEPDR